MLYRLAPDYSVDVVLHDVTISNGLAWTADGTMAYYVDTGTNRIDVFDHDPVEGCRTAGRSWWSPARTVLPTV
jgi:sugar lactone lactonase YvrE